MTERAGRMRPRTRWLSVPTLVPALVPSLLFLGGMAGVGFLSGCAGEDKQLDSMRTELDQIESSRDDADRKAMLPPDDDATDRAPNLPSSATPPTEPAAAPVRREVILGASEEAPDDYADTEDSSPRPVIHVIGAGAPVAGGGRGRA